MLNGLSVEQEKLMLKVKEKWVVVPKMINKKKAVSWVGWLYGLCGLGKPLVVFMPNPFFCQVAANIFRAWGQVGAQVEAQVWEQVGAQVWEQVRVQVGGQVGAQVREQVEAQVWEQVEAQVREQVEAQVWEQVGAQVREQVEAQVWEQVGEQVRVQVGEQVEAQVWEQVRVQVGEQVEAQVWEQVGEQVRVQVGEQVEAQVWEQVREQVREQVEKQTKEQKYYQSAVYANISDYAWLAFYDFFKELRILKNEKFDKYIKIRETGIYDMIQLKGVCIISEPPTRILKDNRKRLHSTTTPAIKFKQYEQHYIHGVYFPEDLWEKVTMKELTINEVLNLENIEQRYATLSVYDPERILQEIKAELLSKTKRGNELFTTDKLIKDKKVYLLRYTCPSTGRIYIKFVPPKEYVNADEAMAETFSINKIEYEQITREA